jgi:glycosyltransferase involved in cell wall biosynthesis
MMPGADSLSATAVSIILPTYNRAKFLPEALAAIRSQQWTDWELIVVDDGSTDETEAVVREPTAGWRQPVRYIRQENRGAYGARNTGLDHARGEYVAFYDSDDLWLPHHLADCVDAFSAHAELDWVYGACQRIDMATGALLTPSAFYENGTARPFLRLRHQAAGRLRIIDDSDTLRCMILHGLYCGLQSSVLRRRVFEQRRFDTSFRNEAEDQLIVIRALSDGHRLAYYDNVHVIYRVHGHNSSAAANDLAVEQRLALYQAQVQGYEKLFQQFPLSQGERRAVAQRLGSDLFWIIGYALLWEQGRQAEALQMFRRGLAYWPWDWRCWKTYLGAAVRHRLGLA